MKNYYDVLEISQSASNDSVKAAYRTKAKELHPDVNDHLEAEQQFKYLREAYDVLTSQKKRQTYDRLGHREYVERFGGSVLDKPSQPTADQQTRESKSTKSPPNSSTRSSQQEEDTERTSAHQTKTSNTTAQSQTDTGFSAESARSHIAKSLALSLITFLTQNSKWVVQGRTPTSSGISASLVRLLIYGLLVQSVAVIAAPFAGGSETVFENPITFTGTLIVARVVYLAGFEHLRTDYIRIDGGATPDAYAIPYAILAGIVGAPLIYFTSVIEHQSGWLMLLLVSGMVLFIYGWITTILGVGWGVADDRYNLGYDFNPPVWNFLVQLPALLLVGSSGTELASSTVPLTIGSSYIVGVLYLLRRYQLTGDIPLSNNRFIVRIRKILHQYV